MNRASLCLYVLRDLGKQMHVYVQLCLHKSCAGGYRQYLAYPAVPCYYLTKGRHCKQRVPISCGMRAVRCHQSFWRRQHTEVHSIWHQTCTQSLEAGGEEEMPLLAGKCAVNVIKSGYSMMLYSKIGIYHYWVLYIACFCA